MDDYYPGCMFPEERRKFEEWYEENEDIPFNLCEVIADYCKTGRIRGIKYMNSFVL